MNIADFHFIRPFWLLALIPAALMIFLLLKNKLNQGNWSAVCDAELLPFILQNKVVNHSRLTLSAGAFSCFLIIFALAGPTWERLPAPVFRNAAALVIALDLSHSMNASDIKPSRISRARYKIADILKKRKDGQTALLAYAGEAFTVTPLTEDTETISSQLSALTTEIMPSQGSNTQLAIKKAESLLKQAGLQTGDILLVTDEADFENTMSELKSLANYRLSVLAVGTKEGAPIKNVQGDFVKDRQGNIVIPKLNGLELSKIAKQGNGIYRRISGDDSDIDALLAQLDNPTEKQQSEDNSLLMDQWSEKGPWLLLLALPFAALSFRKGLLSILFVCLLPFPENSYALEWNDLWQTQNQQASEAFKQQNFQQAAEQFENPQWQAAAHYKAGQFEKAAEALQHDQSATGLYNKGNALAQSGQLQKAIAAYKASLQKNADNADAKYNKEQVEKALKEQQKNQQSDNNKDKSEQDDSNQDPSQKEDKGDEQSGDNADQQGQQKETEQDSNPQQSEQQEGKENSKAEESEAAQRDAQAEEAKEKDENADAQKIPQVSEYDESKQANEQWLNRIPDDPAGLLKRKFKYQYGQQRRKSNNTQAW